ncbi:hypothetical protein [Chryseobacterium sp. HMWF035]|uniref:hypothetical protein n=1 Tax=Chryseobacterium sp. HMWF035 TaxID=2056868 RepID=UPI000D3B3DE2|nr:hypothetical protein [Chryseobacterium sp. HMWF035]PTT77457.1 hypothetical protein DBR25_03020 [Chryseobacterium sp. HMWF001]PVV48986.1 hypothetical protein DD829_23140 [Chryseobacterium sp. HMWF035]
MITFFQEREIEKYLLKKKISGKLLNEIKDHMISGILDIQNDENLAFEEAFERMKMSWSKDMVMVRKNIFSGQKITRLAYEIDKASNKNLFLKSLLFALAFIGSEIILAFFTNRYVYLGIHKIVKAVFFISPFIIVGMYISQKRLEKINFQKNIVLNNFVHPLFVFFLTVVADNLIDLPKNSNNMIYDFVNNHSHTEITGYVFAKSMIAGVLFLTLYLFSYFSLKENIKKLNYKKLYS